MGSFVAEGWASYYGAELRGRRTASGAPFNPAAFTAAHPSFPFGTCLRVVRVANRRWVEVLVNDRGPYAGGRIIDLSQAAAERLGMIAQGVVRVRLYFCPR